MRSKDRRDPRKSERTPSRVIYFKNVMSSKIQPAHLLRNVFGSAPSNITQEPFDANVKHLRRLARLRPGEKADVRDLWEYTQDLLYTDIQGPLFTYLLPFCLEAWREDLRGTSNEYGGFIEQFYPVLANRQVFDRFLTRTQSAAVSDFMRGSILDEIDDQRGLAYSGSAVRPYRWITALTTHGVLFPDISILWNEWWSITTVGRAVAAVQYLSCLMYEENENPIFSPWTPDRGGGPPSLWEFAGHLYTNRWLEPNVSFLKGALSAREVGDVLRRAVEHLIDQPEHAKAAEVLGDLPLCEETLTARCVALPRLLGTPQEPGKLFEW
ncbi:MAG TPA: hypothetical protein VH350_15175 [Candidatus Sulfotelmatobacter sp.]|jgi:hypothetical protein|nr:hypothetical protein [Candidatus Sulfotelmatobacter sp.]